MIRRSAHLLWSDQRFRYLAAGAYNTIWSYAIFGMFLHFLSPRLHYDPRIIADIAGACCIIPNVTVAYIINKLVVFRTHGNYLREYLRSYLVYAIPITSNLIILPAMMTFTAPLFGRFNGYAAQAIITILTVIASYLGHKHVTFRGSPMIREEIEPRRRGDAKEENTRGH